MRILVAGLKKNIQLERLREEGEKRGHIVEGCLASELTILSSNDEFKPSLRGKEFDYDLIYLVVSKRRWEWYVTCYYLKDKFGTVIVNSKVVDPDYKLYITPFMNYYRQFKEKIPYPRSALVFSEKSIPSVMEDFKYPVIVKTSLGRQGRGVFKVANVDELKVSVAEGLEAATSVIIREFIPNDGDIRVLTVGYRAIGAMKRIPAQGDFRSNISLGGKGEKFDLASSPEIVEIAEHASRMTRTEVAGVDIMIDKDNGNPYLLEVNPSPQFKGFEKYIGTNVAEEIIKYFETKKR
jgi:RimK family alpha-L-glutamate ligase